MTSNNFRTAALALRDYVDGTYNLLNAADAVVSAFPQLQESPLPEWERDLLTGRSDQEALTQAALRDPEAMREMRENKKINAIKRLRYLTSCGLKEAKDAIEDPRIINATGFAQGHW